MGGNALAPFGARRYDRQEYLLVRDKFFWAMHKHAPNVSYAEIPSYHNKPSFGDMDILTYKLNDMEYEQIRLACGNSKYVMNDGVMSILFEEIQVDVIPMEDENYNTALIYYSFNDLGNLMGKIYHKFGLKYGHRGLTMPMRDGDNQFEEVVVSKNIHDIFCFLGLDVDRFLKGFDELEDIFKFVMSSKYFSPEPFQYENLNHTNRIRDKKRTTYHAFLEYIKANPCKATYVFAEDKSKYLPMIFGAFPYVKDRYEESLVRLAHQQKVKAHFNGGLVKEWTGHVGLNLGKFMHQLKACYGAFDTWVLDYSQDSLKELVMLELKDFDRVQKMATLDWSDLSARLARLQAKKTDEHQTTKTS
jgi:hypothetical protein